MPKFIKFNAYYGTYKDYGASPKRTILFYTSVTNNVKDVEVLNEPILDWDIGKAGNVTFKLPPCNVGYSAIQCKHGHIFIEQNGKLIWHGRAITDVFDDELNREIICEGALNYLLDTHIKPFNVVHLARYRALFRDLIDCHNRSLTAADSILYGTSEWYKKELSGTISLLDSSIDFSRTNTTEWGLGVYTSPSSWKYKDYAGWRIRVSFSFIKVGSGACDFRYGVHLRNSAWAKNDNSITWKNGPAVTETTDVSWSTFLGSGGLDGSGHGDSYIGFHMYLNGDSGAFARILKLKVELFIDYSDQNEKYFPIDEGLRTGAYRIPYGEEEEKPVVITDYPTTLDAINSIFINEYGGYLYVGYNDNTEGAPGQHAVINYIYGTAERDEPQGPLPEIRYGKNLISFKETTNWENYPTVLIPLGRQKESWEKALPVSDITYIAGRYLDTNGNVQNGTATQYIAEFSVSPDDVYFLYGEGTNELGLYSIVDSSNTILEHKTFSNSDGNWYQHVEVDIPYGAVKMRVFFNNPTQASTITTRIFKAEKFNVEDVEDYISLEGYNVLHLDDGDVQMRTDALAGSKYYPINDMQHIYDYGWIELVVHFDDADTQQALFRRTYDYCIRFQEAVKTYEVEAADLAPIANDDDYIPIGMPGSYGKLIIPKMQIDKALCVTKASVNLRNFARSTYSLANLPPPDLADLIAKGLYYK